MESLEAHLAVLLHTSEDRTYVPMAWFNKVVIAANTISVIPGASVQTFALLESRPYEKGGNGEDGENDEPRHQGTSGRDSLKGTRTSSRAASLLRESIETPSREEHR